jgi:hypothetical protein
MPLPQLFTTKLHNKFNLLKKISIIFFLVSTLLVCFGATSGIEEGFGMVKQFFYILIADNHSLVTMMT